MTATAVELDTIDHLDFEIACQLNGCQAGKPPARWIASWDGCACHTAWCEPCRQAWLAAVRAADALEVVCRLCKASLVLPTATIDDHVRIRPL